MSDDHQPRVQLYILRRDVRLSDNPAFHHAAQQVQGANAAQKQDREASPTSEHDTPSFTHLLPVYIFPANQIESSGFLATKAERSPYPEARSQVAGVWRTGPHRTRFIAEGVWDLKQRLEKLQCGSGLEIRVGMVEDVVRGILEGYAQRDSKSRVSGIWMTSDEGTEEKDDERAVERLANEYKVGFKSWQDEKYFVDE